MNLPEAARAPREGTPPDPEARALHPTFTRLVSTAGHIPTREGDPKDKAHRSLGQQNNHQFKGHR